MVEEQRGVGYADVHLWQHVPKLLIQNLVPLDPLISLDHFSISGGSTTIIDGYIVSNGITCGNSYCMLFIVMIHHYNSPCIPLLWTVAKSCTTLDG